MSETLRDALAAAATALDGINVTPYPRQETLAGEGWVQRVGTEWPNRHGSITTWRVWVPLGQDEIEAEKRADEWTGLLAVALYGEAGEGRLLSIRRVVLQRTQLENGQTVPTLYVEGTRED